jgi:hypothetical protein
VFAEFWQFASAYAVVAVSVKSVTPLGKPAAEALTEVPLVIEAVGLVHCTVVVAFMVIGVFRKLDTGTWKIEAVPAEQELSLIAELIVPEEYEMEVGDPQSEAKLENVTVAFVSAPTSAPIQS